MLIKLMNVHTNTNAFYPINRKARESLTFQHFMTDFALKINDSRKKYEGIICTAMP